MSAVDIAEIEPRFVACGDRDFALGEVLPRQRSGSQMWYDSVTSFPHTELDISSCAGYPSLLKSSDPNSFYVILLHAFYMLFLSEEDFFEFSLSRSSSQH